MTSDAKIGLLLGLVFIFIIAFIINGLPNFKAETDSNELTTNMVSLQNKSIGIGSGVSDSEVLERPGQFDGSSLTVVSSEPAALDRLDRTSAIVDSAVVESVDSDDSVRYQVPLSLNQNVPAVTPMAAESGNANDDLIIEVPEPTKTIEISAPQQEEVAAVVSKPEPVVLPKENSSLREVSSEVVSQVPTSMVKVSEVKEYVVEKGDSLGSIAKKCYGEVEGNRKVNIDKIFEANKKALKSPDAIFVGQKLVIPSIKLSSTSAANKSLGNSGMFETVKSVGSQSSVKPVKSSGGLKKVSGTRSYVVKEGDNLWKIAHNELGDGSRFVELAKLNKEVLKDQNNIVVGMKILLPTK